MIKHFCKLTPMQKCISLLIILLSFNTYSEPRWQLYKNEQGVSIEYQEFSDDTFVVKGQLNIEDVTANDFLDLLSDTRIASSWLENTSKVRVIKALSPSENLVYSYIDSPWPVATVMPLPIRVTQDSLLSKPSLLSNRVLKSYH